MGTVITQFDRVDILYDNIYRVANNGLYGIINNYGAVIFPTIYQSIILLGDSLLRLELNNKFTLSTFEGNLIIKEKLRIEYALNGVYAFFSEKWHFINSKGIQTNSPNNVLLCKSINNVSPIDSSIAINNVTYKSIFNQDPIYTEFIQDEYIAIFANDISQIGEKAFSNCHNLIEIGLPQSIQIIDDFAFEWTGLQKILLPNGLSEIGRFAFYGCCNLEEIHIPDSVNKIGATAFSRCRSLKLISGNFSTEDGKCIIYNNTLYTFAIGCGATEYIIPNNVERIGMEAFFNCRSLTNISIPDNVRSIDDSAFRQCTNLDNITIPSNVASIGKYAFAGCSKLHKIIFKPNTRPIALVWNIGNDEWKAFLGNASGRKFYVRYEDLEKYKHPSYFWNEYLNDIIGYDENSNQV